ncbi:MAG: DNA internalization-related competence protein ComEC/Rec2 [Burkholderiaceae bacterium]
MAAHVGLLLVATGLVLWRFRLRRCMAATRVLGVLLVASGVLAGAGYAGVRASLVAGQRLDPGLENVTLEVTGRVASLPAKTANGARFEFEVERAERSGQTVVVPDRLQLGWYRGPVPVAGDRWHLAVRLRRPHGNANPYGFDRERWLWEQGIGATGTVRQGKNDPQPRRIEATSWHLLERARQWVDSAIADRVGGKAGAGVLSALVVGNQGAIGPEDWAIFRATGVAHLMAISGLHVTMFAWLAIALVGWLWRGLARVRPSVLLVVPAPVAAGVGGIALATVYALFSGWAVPSQRTVIMLAVVAGLRLQARRWPWPVVWLCAMAVVLVLDPWALMQAGFWLSFVAVGILFASDPGRAPADLPDLAGPPPSRLRRLRNRCLGLVREQSVVTVALSPLGLMMFGQFSVAGLLANLVAIPWVTSVVTPLAMLGVLWPPLWDLAVGAVQVLGVLLQYLAGWSWAAVFRPIAPWPMAVLAILGGVALVLRWPPVLRVAGALLVWPVLCWFPDRPPTGQFELVAMDVGQGSAVLVRTASHSLLYDTGPRYSADSDAGERVVVPLLHAMGEVPDVVVVSHSDADHSGGMVAVQRAFAQARWLSSFDGQAHRRCVAGQRWTWDGVRFEVLHPQPRHYDTKGQGVLSTNAMSCVLHVVAGRHSAWLGGDIDAEQETRLALARPDLRATVLVAPHHGSLTSSSPVLLNTLRPSWVVVQAGHLNRFHHPSPRVLARYHQRSIPWVASPGCGAAIWRSEDPARMHCQRQADRRYWHHTGEGLVGALPDAQVSSD